MKLVIIFGPPAVGKMTVGQELEKLTGLPLFHNHMSIEVVRPFFDFGTKGFNRLVTLIRTEIMKEVAINGEKGMIFTFVWAFDLPKEEAYMDQLIKPFTDSGADILYVELEADLEVRFERNKHPNRLFHKPSKRDIANSEKVMRNEVANYRMNSKPGEFGRRPYLKINNTHLSAAETAQQIVDFFELVD